VPKTLTEVAQDAVQLTEAERLKLARILLDLSQGDIDPVEDVHAAWDAEINRRLQELRSGAAKSVSLDEVKKRIESSF
jgi:putative addiction module component (TIGR02574 family)